MRYFLALRVVVSDVPQILMRADLALIFNWRNTTNFIVRYKGRKESHQPKETQSFYIHWRIRTFRVRSCRPGDKLGGGGGETVSKQNFFQPFGPQFGLKIRRSPAPRALPLDTPLTYSIFCNSLFATGSLHFIWWSIL